MTAAEDAPALRSIADRINLEIGSIHSHPMPALEADLLRRHCHVVAPENGMKTSWIYLDRRTAPDWQVRSACADRHCFAAGDAARDFAQGAGLALHGHTIYWPKHGLPPAAADPPDEVRAAWRAHIEAIVARYPDAVSWDVLNEVLADDWGLLRRAGWGALRPDPQLGSDPDSLLDHYAFCINVMREALERRGRTARLMLNEADLNGGRDGHALKREAVLDLMRALDARGARLDGAGIQCHLKTRSPPDGVQVATFIRSLAAEGYSAHVSELDFLDDRPDPPSVQEDDLQAGIVGRFLDTVLAEPTVLRLAFWGLSDPHHPLQRVSGTRGFGLAPALFHQDESAKPVVNAVAEAIARAPTRKL